MELLGPQVLQVGDSSLRHQVNATATPLSKRDMLQVGGSTVREDCSCSERACAALGKCSHTECCGAHLHECMVYAVSRPYGVFRRLRQQQHHGVHL